MNHQVELKISEDAIEKETEPTSPGIVILAAIVFSIPLGLCCYLLLRL